MALLEGRNAIVTGGAKGIGKAIAQALAGEGANVLIADLDAENARAAADDIRVEGVKAEGRYLDIGDVDGASAFAAAVEDEFGPADILVNNAGVCRTVSVMDMTPDEWDRVMDINIRGTFFLTQQFFGRMTARGSGRIISLGSISGERGARFAGMHYSVSKAGVIMMTKALALNAADTGVTVNTVSPGIIDTEMTRSINSVVDPKDVPMNRMGTADEVAQAVVFLASDMAAYVTGQNISVNGGQSMR